MFHATMPLSSLSRKVCFLCRCIRCTHTVASSIKCILASQYQRLHSYVGVDELGFHGLLGLGHLHLLISDTFLATSALLVSVSHIRTELEHCSNLTKCSTIVVTVCSTRIQEEAAATAAACCLLAAAAGTFSCVHACQLHHSS